MILVFDFEGESWDRLVSILLMRKYVDRDV